MAATDARRIEPPLNAPTADEPEEELGGVMTLVEHLKSCVGGCSSHSSLSPSALS